MRIPAGMLGLAVLAASTATASPAAPRDIQASVPASPLDRIEVRAGVGTLKVTGGTGEAVELRLRILPEASAFGLAFVREMFGERRGHPDALELVKETSGRTLRLDLRGERRGLKEQWELTVPGRLAAELHIKVGDVDVREVAGGLTVEAGVGDVRADLPGGEVRAKVNVGDLRVASRSADYGPVSLEANVGDASLRVGTERVQRPRKPGPGHRIAYDGRGRERIDLAVNVGDASLSLPR
jgi:hypothetical protein